MMGLELERHVGALSTSIELARVPGGGGHHLVRAITVLGDGKPLKLKSQCSVI
jgi:hypothetical protein